MGPHGKPEIARVSKGQGGKNGEDDRAYETDAALAGSAGVPQAEENAHNDCGGPEADAIGEPAGLDAGEHGQGVRAADDYIRDDGSAVAQGHLDKVVAAEAPKLVGVAIQGECA